MSLDRWADGDAGERLGGGVAADRSSSSFLFLRCFFFCHLAYLLLLPSSGSKRKVGGGAAAGMMSLDRWADGDAGDRLGGGVAAVALPLLCCFYVACSLCFFCSSINNVLPSLQRLRGGAGGGGLGADSGRSTVILPLLCVFFCCLSPLCLCFPLCSLLNVSFSLQCLCPRSPLLLFFLLSRSPHCLVLFLFLFSLLLPLCFLSLSFPFFHCLSLAFISQRMACGAMSNLVTACRGIVAVKHSP